MRAQCNCWIRDLSKDFTSAQQIQAWCLSWPGRDPVQQVWTSIRKWSNRSHRWKNKQGCACNKNRCKIWIIVALTSIHRTDQFLPRRSCQRVQQVYWGLICNISISSPAGQRPNWRSSRTQGSCLQRGLCSPTSTMGPWIGNKTCVQLESINFFLFLDQEAGNPGTIFWST